MMKKLLCSLLVMSLALGLGGCSSNDNASPQEETPQSTSQDGAQDEPAETPASKYAQEDYIIGGGSSGGTYNAVSSVFAQFLSKAGVANFTAQATTGSGQNITYMKNGNMEFGLANASVCRDAQEGLGLFEGEPYGDIRAICMIYPGVFQQFVSTNSGINTVEDLFGKKLCIGGPGSGDVSAAAEVYGAFGMTFDDFSPQYLGSSEGADSMKDGHIDGSIGIAQIPYSAFMELTSSAINKAKIISLSDEAITNLTTGDDARYFPYTIPAGSYGNQTEDIKTVANGQLFVTIAETDDDLVYEITKAIFEDVEELASYHNALTDLNIEEAIEVSGITLHPGAEKYYKEIGLID